MITPGDTPSSPEGYAGVTPHGRGTAPYDVQAGNEEAAITSAFNGANAVAGAGVLYSQGPRQAETEALLSSPAGFAVDGYDVDAGYHAGPGRPANVEPGG
jgi:hypothetical protein